MGGQTPRRMGCQEWRKQRATNVTKTQREAIEIGREFAKKHASELIIQSREGKIRSKDSYGNDPNPPKDTEH